MEIQDVITSYAAALNKGDADALAGLYNADCMFKAKHYKAVTGRDTIRARAARFLQRHSFTIDIRINDIMIAGNVAVVKADAVTSDGKSEDIFVLLRTCDQWKILLYFIYESSSDL